MDLIRAALRVDAAVSAATAAVLVAGSVPVARFLDVPAWLPAAIGASFVPWVALLLAMSARDPIRRGDVIAVIAANSAWVVGSVVLIVGFPDALSTPGRVAAAVVALVVADLAVVQSIGLRRLVGQRSASTKNSSAWQATSPST